MPARQRSPDETDERRPPIRALIGDIFSAALRAVDPFEAVKRSLKVTGSALEIGARRYDLDAYDRVLVVGAGKATARMAAAVEDALGDRIHDGVIIVKYGHSTPLRRIHQIEAGHPLPDEAGEKGSRRVIGLLGAADERTLILCLLSGGGSALLVSPEQDITLRDKQLATDLLLRSGANIDELNAVRKHLSAVKGGRLARIAYPAAMVTLLVSDVIGDRLDVIASGPTVPDTTTFPDAWAVIEKYRLSDALPEKVRRRLQRGIAGQEEETPKEGDPCFQNVTTMIVAGLGQALSAAREHAVGQGLRARIITRELHGEARDAARFLAGEAARTQRELADGERECLLSGGETVVSVTGTGKGGRNQELALAFALNIDGKKGITLLAAGTDGTDGPTDAAGAVVDGDTVVRARERGLDPQSSLANHDSYTFFEQYDIFTGERCHLKTGPTGTNVMDMQLILLEGRKLS